MILTKEQVHDFRLAPEYNPYISSLIETLEAAWAEIDKLKAEGAVAVLILDGYASALDGQHEGIETLRKERDELEAKIEKVQAIVQSREGKFFYGFIVVLLNELKGVLEMKP